MVLEPIGKDLGLNSIPILYKKLKLNSKWVLGLSSRYCVMCRTKEVTHEGGCWEINIVIGRYPTNLKVKGERENIQFIEVLSEFHLLANSEGLWHLIWTWILENGTSQIKNYLTTLYIISFCVCPLACMILWIFLQ